MSAPVTSTGVDVTAYLDEWLVQAPEMELALVFTGAGRRRSLLWGAILNQWLIAIFEPGDAGVAHAKLSWWAQAMAEAPAKAQHPLIAAFASECGNAVEIGMWQGLHQAAAQLVAQEASPTDVAALIDSRLDLARAIVAIELALWPQAGAGDASSVARSLILWQWRWRTQGEVARVGMLPLNLLARHGLRATEAYGELATAAASVRLFWQDLAGELLRLATPQVGPRLRRICTRLDSLALKRLQRGHAQPFPASGLAVLWQCWQGGRGTPA